MASEQLSGAMSHEFRTPLSSIIGFTGILLMKLPGPLNKDQERQLHIIEDSARSLLSLINGFADGTGMLPKAADSSEPPIGKRQFRPTRGGFHRERLNRRARILVVEDDPSIRKLMVCFLTAFGHDPLTAIDGEEALAIARLEMPDLVLCDLQLPKLSGHEVARELKRDPVLRHIPLVAVSVNAPIGGHDNGRMGAFDFSLVKPFHPETMALQLASILAGT